MLIVYEMVMSILLSFLAFQLGKAVGNGNIESSISWLIPGLLTVFFLLGFIIHRNMVIKKLAQRIRDAFDSALKQPDQS